MASIETKGQYFASSVKYVGFQWDLETRHVSLLEKKQVKILAKIDSFLSLQSPWSLDRTPHPYWLITTYYISSSEKAAPPFPLFCLLSQSSK